ncbi:protein-tyrosine phosphatase [Agrococcus sp. UYP10]|uniref:arsenate reductase/protein-tyrosine-phosphatase family protein n=1 Tax=Agrococcus sp. UYP10 TaxID=1756355 RepID=UPI0033925E03
MARAFPGQLDAAGASAFTSRTHPPSIVADMPLPSQRTVAARDRSSFSILTVCTGNICRSPQAEHLLRLRFDTAFGAQAADVVVVGSAGTLGYDGQRIDEQARAEAERLGALHAAGHRARRLRPDFIERADLILGMSREHRGAAASMLPSANRRAFALVEFARVLEALAQGRVDVGIGLDRSGLAPFMHSVVEAAATARGLVAPPHSRVEDDIIDPYRLSADVYRQSADAVQLWVGRTMQALTTLAGQPFPDGAGSQSRLP